jgi:formylglycine-generating enzyme required for sulfatase activity
MKTRKHGIICVIALAALAFTGCCKRGGTNKNNVPKLGDIFVSSSGIELAWIPGGTFTMGSPETEKVSMGIERPQHQVTLDSFYIGKYEVTQAQYETVMGTNPGYFTTDADTGETQNKRPIETVSWYDALVFCNKLSISEDLTPAYSIDGKTNPDEWGAAPTDDDEVWNAVIITANSNGYRLPTEAQWEYACRAGTTTAYNTGDTISDDTGWYGANSNSKTHEVGKKPPNAWGLYDMHGNVFEWCWDRWGYYTSEAQSNPSGAPSESYRVVRSGGWHNTAGVIHSACLDYGSPRSRNYSLGFRLVRPFTGLL